MIGIYGGTYDPIHQGHLHLAKHVADTLALDQVQFVVARQNPLKIKNAGANASHRMEMLKLALRETKDPRFVSCDFEINKPPPSYTVNTLHHFHANNQNDIALIMGNEVFNTLPRWKEPRQILQFANIVVVQREQQIPIEFDCTLSQIEVSILKTTEHSLEHSLGRWIKTTTCAVLPFSSTDIRQKLNGHSIHAAPVEGLPNCVWNFIKENSLYSVKA